MESGVECRFYCLLSITFRHEVTAAATTTTTITTATTIATKNAEHDGVEGVG